MNLKQILSLSFIMLFAAGLSAQVPAPTEAANMEKATVAAKNLVLSTDLEVPYLSIYYVEPNVRTDQDIKIKFYVTDWHQSEYRLQDKSHRFNVFLRITDSKQKEQKFEMRNIGAGDHTFEVGKLPEGDYQLRLYAIDRQKRYSPSIFHLFRVRTTFEIPAADTYKMTENDLSKYGIDRNGDHGILHFVDATDKKEEETKAIVEAAAAKLTPPAGKYLIVVGSSKAPADLLIGKQCGAYDLPTPEWLPNSYSRKTAKVIYHPSYDKAKVEADAEKNGNAINQFLKDMSAKGVRKVVFLPGTYRISHKNTIQLPSKMTVDLNGATIKLNGNTEKNAVMISLQDCFDSHLLNGTLEGDYFEHDYSVNKHSEWLNGVDISGSSQYCSVKNLVVRFITGYGVTNGFRSADFSGFSPLKFTPGTVNRKNGKEIKKPGLQISQMVSVKLLKEKFGCITASRALGYQGMAMDDWNLMFHFYDSEKKYLTTIDGEQYRRVYVPAKAEYVRVTVWAAGEIKEQRFYVNFFRIPQNCVFENILVQNARCVGVAPCAMYNFKFANFTITRSGESLACCAFDAEDGWDMMQDVWLYRNRFIGNPRNELLTCAGHNFVFEENEAALHLWSRTAAYVIRKNKFKSASFGYANRKRTRLVRIEDNNTYTGNVRYGDDHKEVDPLDLMNLYAAELAGKSRPLDSNWLLLARGNFSGGGIQARKTGALYGSDLSKMPNDSGFNLLMSRLRDTSLTWLARSNFVNCIIDNCKFSMFKATKKISGCKIKNTHFQLSQETHLILENCTLENVDMRHGWWITPCKVTLINCIVKNTDKPLINTPSYSTGVITLENCLIDTGSAPTFDMYDTRAQKTDDQPGSVIFKQCDIVNTAGCIVKAPGAKNQKAIRFDILGTNFNGTPVSEPSPKWTVNVSEARSTKEVKRGWDETIELKILDLIQEQN